MSPTICIIPPALHGVAFIIAVCRARPSDLPKIMGGWGPSDDKRDDDDGETPPSLPKP